MGCLIVILAFVFLFFVACILTALINIILVAFGLVKISIWVTFAFIGACSILKWLLKDTKE